MKVIRRIFCLVLVLIMCFGSAANMYAASSNKKYVSDIKIGYGEWGKEELKRQGYTVNEKLDANANGRGSASRKEASVWIGFKETTNPMEAITDVAVMNMNGSYSFDAWATEYANIKNQVETMLDDFMTGVKEFRTNYKNNSPYAIKAKELMNIFKDPEFTGKLMGDLLLDENINQEILLNIFVMGNFEFIRCIEQCIAMGCTEWVKSKGVYNTFVYRLNKNGYCTDEIDPAYNHERELISNAIANLKPEIDKADTNREGYYLNYSNNKEAYKLDEKDIPEGATAEEIDKLQFEKYINSQCSEDQISDYFYYETLNEILQGITIKQEKTNRSGEVTQKRESLYDLIKKNASELVENDFETIRRAMTAGQNGVVEIVGLPILLFYEAGVTKGTFLDDYEKTKDELDEEYDVDVISIFYGVDLDAFQDPENTAFTDDAIAAMRAAASANFAVDPESDATTTRDIVMYVSLGTAGVALVPLIYVGVQKLATIGTATPYLMSSAVTVMVVVAIIVAVVAIITLLVALLQKPANPKSIAYTQIPNVIVDMKVVNYKGIGNQKVYYTYTCAKRIDAKEDKDYKYGITTQGNSRGKDTMEIYGDLNQYNSRDEWVAVYYTKNRSCGNPITAESLVNPSTTPTSGYCAIHEFGTTAAVDLNKYNSGKNKTSVYAYIKTTTFNDNQVATIMLDQTSLMMLVGTFVVGAGLSGIITYTKTRKKYKAA